MSTKQNDIGNTWDAKRYDDGQNFVWKFGGNVVETLAPQANESILDLGSGTGHLAAKIAEAAAHVIGVDGSAEMVAEAKELYPAVRFFHVDARTLLQASDVGPDRDAAALLGDAAFDAVFSNATLHWIPQAAQVIAGVRRVLKLGGRFVAEFGGIGNVSKVHNAIAAARAKLGYEPRPSILYFPTPGAYAKLLEADGFEIATLQLFDRPTPLQGEHGLSEWARTFARNEIDDVRETDLQRFYTEIENAGRLELHDGTQWVADYRRLRFTARRIR